MCIYLLELRGYVHSDLSKRIKGMTRKEAIKYLTVVSSTNQAGRHVGSDNIKGINIAYPIDMMKTVHIRTASATLFPKLQYQKSRCKLIDLQYLILPKMLGLILNTYRWWRMTNVEDCNDLFSLIWHGSYGLKFCSSYSVQSRIKNHLV